MEQPITERSNELSLNLDVSSPAEIAKILYKCDQEIFHGWNGSEGLGNSQIKDKIHSIATVISEVLAWPESSTVVISGCGTSGRLAFLTARTFNQHLASQGKEACFQYIVAGRDLALFTSQELSEDDPTLGAEELQKVVAGKRRVVYIGVTCGMSAPFVAGQLDYCLSHLDFITPVLIGFNPTHLARNVSIEKWDKTFFQVVQELEKAEKLSRGYILNPVIGPEPITGSSRMKSGSATRILLELLCLTALGNFEVQSISHVLGLYQATCDCVYEDSEALGKLIQQAGTSLVSEGRVYYLGCDGLALMGMIDASECKPTYGASLDDIRGFVYKGFEVMQNNDGNISHLGKHYRISTSDFEADILPTLHKNDVVIFLGEDILTQIDENIFQVPCSKALVLLQVNQSPVKVPHQHFDQVFTVSLNLPALNSVTPDLIAVTLCRLLQEIAIKWVVNSLSTGAHVLKGKVYKNAMVDVRVSNNKLFYRARGIVQRYSGLNEEDSELCLLKSIYRCDELTAAQIAAPVSDHVKATESHNLVVPTAILMARLHCTVQEAQTQIQKQPVLRKLFTSDQKDV